MAKHETSKKGTHKPVPDKEANPVDMKGSPFEGQDAVNGSLTDENLSRQEAQSVEEEFSSAEETVSAQFGEEIHALRELATRKESEAKEHYDRLTYMAAEFDNFRRRTAKEKERLFSDAIVDVTGAFLPIKDNLERAVKAAEAVESPEALSLREGVAMVIRQFGETLEKLGVKEIEAQGAPFDPNLHNAVMHVEDPSFGPNEVADVFQKGYRHKEGTVIRHAMVKVVN